MRDLFFLELDVGNKSKADLLAACEARGRKISSRAEEMLQHPSWNSGRKERVRFGHCQVGELGFTANPQTPEIVARLEELGHACCEPNDALELRCALGAHDPGQYFWVLTKEVPDADDDPSMFYLENDDVGRPRLNAGLVDVKRGWPLDFKLVFRLGS